MIIRQIRPEEKDKYNSVVTHPLQSWEWGEFRKLTGVEVIRMGLFDGQRITSGFQVTLHPVPKTPFFVGYVPKCVMPNDQMIEALKQVACQYRCIFIKLEPNVGTVWQDEVSAQNSQKPVKDFLFEKGCVYGRPLFTKYSFQLDLTRTEEEIFMGLKQKTRYNVRVAQKAGVQIVEDNTPQGFEEYLKLTFETTKRQQFYAHNADYHKKMWSVMNPSGIGHLLKAVFAGKTLVTWVLFNFNNFLYYPYGASSSQDRQVMASNLMMWEAIRFGKSKLCRKFDLWGSLGPNADPKDPWYGFHKFKEGYNPALIEFVGTYDLVINQNAYKLYNIADNLRWKALKLKALLPF